jgi:hypothetical protein
MSGPFDGAAGMVKSERYHDRSNLDTPPRSPSQYEGVISAELRQLRNAIETLEASFGDHCSRISAVLGPESPQTAIMNKEPVQITMSPLHDELDNLTRRIHSFRRSMEAVSNRITL